MNVHTHTQINANKIVTTHFIEIFFVSRDYSYPQMKRMVMVLLLVVVVVMMQI
jgi:hypothetical protein